MAKVLRYIDADGEAAFAKREDGEPWPRGAVEVPRMPGEFEDYVNGQWVRDNRSRADHVAGQGHIAEARALKYLEALLIASGLPLLRGLLVEEAKAKKITALELANLVLSKRAGFIAAEVTRQRGQAGQ